MHTLFSSVITAALKSGHWNLSLLPLGLSSIWSVRIVKRCLITQQCFCLAHLLHQMTGSQDTIQIIMCLSTIPCLTIFSAMSLSIKHRCPQPLLYLPSTLFIFYFAILLFLSVTLFILFWHHLVFSMCLLIALCLFCSNPWSLSPRKAERRMSVLKRQKEECILKEEKTLHYMGAVLSAAEHISKERDQLLHMVHKILYGIKMNLRQCRMKRHMQTSTCRAFISNNI